jgi:hypothetical protein
VRMSRRRQPIDVFCATRQLFDPGSSSCDGVLRGGVLEPEPRAFCEQLAC